MTTAVSTKVAGRRRAKLPEWFDCLRTPGEVDRRYRMRDKTAIKAAKAGLVKHVERDGRFLICPMDAERLWGAR